MPKEMAVLRQRAEARIPKELLYTKGWPTKRVSLNEAQLIADVRNDVASLLNLHIGYTTADQVVSRYRELIVQQAVKSAALPKGRRSPMSHAAVLDDEDLHVADVSLCK